MKKKVLIGLAVLTLVALLAVGTWAWFTATAGPVTNTFTAGTVKIGINDTYEEVTNWNPGDTSSKVVSITNEGSKCAYVRVKLTPEWGSIVEDEFVKDEELGVSNVTLNWNDTDWMYDEEDDYYYYKSTLASGATTEDLLESVTLIGLATDDTYQGKVFRLTVDANAVQCTNDAYKDVWKMDSLPWESNNGAE